MSGFYLCNDPMGYPPEGFVDYIYHHGTPKFFGAMFEFYLLKEFKPIDYALPNKIFVYTRGDGHTRIFMLLIEQRSRNITAKLEDAMYRAISWYVSVLNHTDEKKTGKRSSYRFLADFNESTPGLQLANLGEFAKPIASYPGGVRSFDNSTDMDKFLSEVLCYIDEQLYKGSENFITIKKIPD
ncbi:MAG TPA: hypothetical protein VFX43_02250 [Chitinophagaceae bacterium]|nr:hypothetical protein [Chitinophagaceae bacterium]